MAAARFDGFRLMSSAAAVYSMAITSSAAQRSCASASTSEESRSPQQIEAADSSELATGKVEAGRFTPKFDGLRFIETLVTAHR